MDADLAIGLTLIAGSTLVYVGLYIWSARRIDMIAAKRLTSLRSIIRELHDGRR